MKAFVLVLCMFVMAGLQAQMLPDTVSIPEVEVHSFLKLSEAGVESQPVDSLVMQREAQASLSDLLASHTAVFIKSEGRGALATASFRGTDASHTRVYWNGLNIQSPMLGQVDFSQIPVFLMDKIVLHAGASSLSDGSGGLGGSIDLVSRAGWNQKWQLDALAGFGSYMTFDNFVGFGAGSKKFRSSTKLYYNSSRNDFPFYNKNIADIDPQTGAYVYPLQRNEQAGYLLDGVLQEFAWRIGKKALLQFHYWFQNASRALPRLNTYEGDDHANLSRQHQKTHRSVVQLTRAGKYGQFHLNLGFQWEDMDYRVQNLIGGRGYYDAVSSRSKALGSYNKLKYSYQWGKKSRIEASCRFNFEKVDTYDSVSRNGYHALRRQYALMVSWQQRIRKRWTVMALVRKEWIDQQALPVIPYLGFDFLINRKTRWILHGNVARNFRFPSLNDLYWQPGGNPSLKPEKGLLSELGLRMKIIGKRMVISPQVNGFYNNITDWILWTPSPMGYWSPDNVRHVISRGLDVKVNVKWTVGTFRFYFKMGYAFTKSTNEGDAEKWGTQSLGKQIPYVPVHSGNFTGEMRWNDFFLTWVNTSYSERFTTSTHDLNRRDRLYPYFMNDLYAGKAFHTKWGTVGLQIKIYNLFNEEYRSVLGRPMPGRNYLFTLTFKR